MIQTLLLLCSIAQIKTVVPQHPWNIEIVTKKTQEYLLLTKQEPISLTVEGPTYLRVYTRILLPDKTHDDHLYKLILAEGPMDERIISFQTTRSTVTSDKHGTMVSKWRSFYIDVPEGMNTYTLTHWDSPRDTILVRFAYESPQPWNIVPATEYTTMLEMIEEERSTRYYELQKDDRVAVTVSGPTRLRITARLNYDETLFGEQSFTLGVSDNGSETTFPLKCYRSDTLHYQNRSDIVPSNARTAYLTIESGTHTLVFSMYGTLAKSAALRFETAP
ncbi:hypothetical protein JXB22_05595 [candidate division WOR-3 bacterium]|nr:hypothetical protein [candidate division WOR-3 bacterium]